MPSAKQKDAIEEIKEIIKVLGMSHKRTQEAQERMQERMQEAQERTQEAQERAEKEMQEIRETLKKQAQNLDKADGNFNNKWGRFMEDLVKGDLINLLNNRKIDVIRILSRVPYYRPDKTQDGEVDLIALNGKELVVVEIKTFLTIQDVNKFIKILNSFKKLFPEYTQKTIYGAVAFLDQNDADDYAKSKGLFVIKAPGGEAKVSTITNSEDFNPKEFGD